MQMWSRKFFLFLFGIVVLAIATRFYQLGSVPHGLTWDEAAIGYNGYAILTTRRDEWIVRLPVSFRSFGDYKAPLAIYLNGPFTYLFGLTPFAVRLSFAIAGVFAVLGWILLQHELRVFKRFSVELSLVAGSMLALNPWHIHYSRIAFESGLSLAFAVWGWLLLARALRAKRLVWWLVNGFGSAVLLSASIYTYHSAKIVVPIMSIVVFLFAIKSSKKSVLRILLIGLVSLLLLIPLLRDSLFGPGATRAGVLLFNQNYSLSTLLQMLVGNFFAQLSPAFLLLGKNIATLRDGGVVWGFLHPTTYVLCVIALPLSVWLKEQGRATMFAVLLVVVGSAPAILATEAPHSNRGLFAVLGFILLAVVGGVLLIKLVTKQGQMLQKSLLGLLVLLHVFFFISYEQAYFSKFAKESAVAFQDGYIEAFSIAREFELGQSNKPKVDKILFSSEYGQPYIYALFVRKTNPIWYQGGSLNTYEFSDRISVGDLNRVNTLVVATPSQGLPADRADHIVMGSNGDPRFEIYVTK
ncbi:MAG: hypothetical protein O2840_01025 [bacterium]|nr:hypothetical protein [bacterium]